MATRFQFHRLALDANETRTNVRDVDVLPILTLDERVALYLRAVHGNRDFSDEERSNARNILLNSMAAQIAAQGIPADQSPKEGLAGREKKHGADRRSFLAQYSRAGVSAQGQESAIEVGGPLPQHPYEAASREEAIRVAPIARRRTGMLALSATLGLVLIVTGGTLGYRWAYPDMADEVTAPEQQGRVPPPNPFPRSLSTGPAADKAAPAQQAEPAPDKVAPEQHVVQILSQRSEADVIAVFRALQKMHPTLLGQATLKPLPRNFNRSAPPSGDQRVRALPTRIDRALQSYTAQIGPFASEKDVAAVCGALEAADIHCLGQ
jgi:hypothetical protein